MSEAWVLEKCRQLYPTVPLWEAVSCLMDCYKNALEQADGDKKGSFIIAAAMMNDALEAKGYLEQYHHPGDHPALYRWRPTAKALTERAVHDEQTRIDDLGMRRRIGAGGL